MKTNYFKNYKKSYNSFNPFNYYQTINPKKINGNSLKMTIESNNRKKGYKKNLWKKQGINFNSSEIIQSKKDSKNFAKYNNNKELSTHYKIELNDKVIEGNYFPEELIDLRYLLNIKEIVKAESTRLQEKLLRGE